MRIFIDDSGRRCYKITKESVFVEEFSVNRNSIKINFSKKYCRTSAELLDSGGFHRILELYLKKLYRKNTEIYRYIASKFTNAGSRVSGERAAASIAKNVIELFKLLIVFDLEEVKKYDSTNIFSRKDLLLEFVEDLYNFWRSFERYALIINKDKETAVQQTNFFSNMSDFTNLVLTTYRKVTETLMLSRFKVYRQLTAGVNIGLTISRTAWNAPVGSCYKKLARIDFVKTVILQPPFFVYTKQNTRKGLFSEVSKNPLEEVEFSAGEWLCYPVKIGDYLAFVYFNIDFMAQGVTLANLFEIASVSEYKNHKPDL
ncbi:MAG: hypothetical protein LBJ71_02220, partial [Holosporaceae bacterium]|nr:hypothetical protein [Holosporaceae bacterium]